MFLYLIVEKVKAKNSNGYNQFELTNELEIFFQLAELTYDLVIKCFTLQVFQLKIDRWMFFAQECKKIKVVRL